ncbi:Selenocysteine insertion sequence-binding protein 2-like [Anthophora retusa]
MPRSQMDNLTWSFHASGIANMNNPWPELCQKNQIKHPARKKDFINILENRIVSLDNMEYPQLGGTIVKNRSSVLPREECLPSCSVQTLVPLQTNMESKRSKTLKRYKRPDKICINLQEALQNTRCLNKMNNKEFPKLKINLYMGNLGFTVPNMLDRNKVSDFRKVRICISKDKKISKLKRIILFNRDMKAQINIRKREAFERGKVEAVCRDVDAINFNALKITADPEIDVDYTRGMCTMTLYGNDYRVRNEINISDDTLCHRPDVIDKINNLKIQGRQLTYRVTGDCNQMQFPQPQTDAIENDIADQILSLKIEEDVKQETNTEIDDKSLIKFSRNFREYCTNLLTSSLNDSLEIFLKEITRLQKRYHAKYPSKSQYKRRYYSGLKEVRKQAELRKLKFVIIAPDIEKVELEDGLDDQVEKLLEVCRRQNVVYGFGLRRRKLGYYTHGKGFVGCVGIANYSGTELLFKNVLVELVHARNAFKKLNGAAEGTIDISKVVSDDYLPSENINALLKILSHNMHS